MGMPRAAIAGTWSTRHANVVRCSSESNRQHRSAAIKLPCSHDQASTKGGSSWHRQTMFIRPGSTDCYSLIHLLSAVDSLLISCRALAVVTCSETDRQAKGTTHPGKHAPAGGNSAAQIIDTANGHRHYSNFSNRRCTWSFRRLGCCDERAFRNLQWAVTGSSMMLGVVPGAQLHCTELCAHPRGGAGAGGSPAAAEAYQRPPCIGAGDDAQEDRAAG